MILFIHHLILLRHEILVCHLVLLHHGILVTRMLSDTITSRNTRYMYVIWYYHVTGHKLHRCHQLLSRQGILVTRMSSGTITVYTYVIWHYYGHGILVTHMLSNTLMQYNFGSLILWRSTNVSGIILHPMLSLHFYSCQTYTKTDKMLTAKRDWNEQMKIRRISSFLPISLSCFWSLKYLLKKSKPCSAVTKWENMNKFCRKWPFRTTKNKTENSRSVKLSGPD